MLNFLMPQITETRGSLQCSDAASISSGTKLLCLCLDATVPYWIWLVISVAIGITINRLTLS